MLIFLSMILILLITLLVVLVVSVRKDRFRKLINEYSAEIDNFYAALDALCSHYVCTKEANAFKEQWPYLYKKVSSTNFPRDTNGYEKIASFLLFYDSLSEEIDQRNKDYIKFALAHDDSKLFEVDGKKLDKQQAEVVLSDEDKTLVIAGAGSGKTLTITGKVKYLCYTHKAKPEEILLISFTNKAADKMTERIKNKLNIPITATTFHKLGLSIITKALGYRPVVYDNIDHFIENLFETKLINEPDFIKDLTEFFAYYLDIPSNIQDFRSLGALYEHERECDLETLKSKYERELFLEDEANIRKKGLITLRDEHVKSVEETKIANFLFINGINYEYEKLYPYEVEGIARKAYRPDFYLPDYDIYLEHFGITEDYRCPWLTKVEEKKYIDSIIWKRALHLEHGTKLLETYSYYTEKGILFPKLKELLLANGVQFKPLPFNDIFNKIYAKKSNKYFSEFLKLCTTFIVLFKSNNSAIGKLDAIEQDSIDNDFLYQRNKLFLDIIRRILAEYDAFLKANNMVDFSDMVNIASNNVALDKTIAPYKYVIVDEYQDISVSRFMLLKAILDETKAKLLCVGDDWQSIFRFAGSDVSLLTNIEEQLGPVKLLKIEKTYRSSQELLNEAAGFITKNPIQIKKELTSDKHLDYPLVFWGFDFDPIETLDKIIQKIISEFGPDKSIMLLGRNNFDIDFIKSSDLFTIKNNSISYNPSPSTPISFCSVHKAKGLEADNVILINFRNDKIGFPNQIVDDEILNYVLTQGDSYPFSEERRLFYVAITRTRNRTFVLTDNALPSVFLKDFKESKTCCFIHIKKEKKDETAHCPRCKTGLLYLIPHGRNSFIGCSNYPLCHYTIKEVNALSNPKVCPSCGGYLIKRKSANGFVFLGCTNYPYCSYTEKINKEQEHSPN